MGIASPGQKAGQPMPRWVTQDTLPVSAISLECRPRSVWNGVRHHGGMLSAIRAERCPRSRGIRTTRPSETKKPPTPAGRGCVSASEAFRADCRRTGGGSGRRPSHPAQRLPQQAKPGQQVPKRRRGLTRRRTCHLSAVRPPTQRSFGAQPALTLRSRGGHPGHRWRPAKAVGRHDERAPAAQGGRPWDVPTAWHRGSAPGRHRRPVGEAQCVQRGEQACGPSRRRACVSP